MGEQHKHDNKLVLVGLLIVSVIYTAQSSILCKSSCGSLTAYAVSVGVISAVICILNLVLHLLTDEADKINVFLAVLLAVWWYVYMCVLYALYASMYVCNVCEYKTIKLKINSIQIPKSNTNIYIIINNKSLKQ